jgi:hypothetical protein
VRRWLLGDLGLLGGGLASDDGPPAARYDHGAAHDCQALSARPRSLSVADLLVRRPRSRQTSDARQGQRAAARQKADRCWGHFSLGPTT